MNFTIYSKDGCPYCTRIKQILDLCQFKYREYKLDEHFDKHDYDDNSDDDHDNNNDSSGHDSCKI